MASIDLTQLSDDQLLGMAGDLDAMRELARRENPTYMAAFREACIEVLGEDPDEDWTEPKGEHLGDYPDMTGWDGWG